MKYSTASATRTTSAEIRKPCTIGAAPDFFISAKLVLSPTAASAVTMRNLLTFLSAAAVAAAKTVKGRAEVLETEGDYTNKID